MKKEGIAALALLLLLAAALWNSYTVSRMASEIAGHVAAAAERMEQGDIPSAERRAQAAADAWNARSGYVRLVLRHGEIDAVTASLRELSLAVGAGDGAAASAAAETALYRLRAMAELERVSPGSIF